MSLQNHENSYKYAIKSINRLTHGGTGSMLANLGIHLEVEVHIAIS